MVEKKIITENLVYLSQPWRFLHVFIPLCCRVKCQGSKILGHFGREPPMTFFTQSWQLTWKNRHGWKFSTMTFFTQPWHFTGKKRHGWKFENNRIFTFHTSTMTFLKKKRHGWKKNYNWKFGIFSPTMTFFARFHSTLFPSKNVMVQKFLDIL